MSMRRRRESNSWTIVPVPSHPIADCVLELAAPLLGRLGPTPSIENARAAIALTVRFWNASVLASQRWNSPSPTARNEHRKLMRSGQIAHGDAATFDELARGWREHWLDPRLVESWTYDTDEVGVGRLMCTAALPEGVKAEQSPPIEKRIGIAGRFLDEVRVAQGGNAFVGFPAERHRSVLDDDGTATIYAMMPTALQLFAEGRLPRVGGEAIELLVGGRGLGPMVLVELRCGGDNLGFNVAVLVFKPAPAKP
jgi:hypothetical protein